MKLTLILTAAAILSLSAAAPAYAESPAPLPSGDRMYTIPCDQVYNDWQLLEVDPATGVSSPIGSGAGVNSKSVCARQPAYNPVNGLSYYIQDDSSSGDNLFRLATVDLTTGVSTPIALLKFEGSDVAIGFVPSMAITKDGSAFAWVADDPDNGSVVSLYQLNLTTGELSFIGGSGSVAYGGYEGFAMDPTTGTLYAIDGDGSLFTVDASTGQTTFVVQVPVVGNAFALQIDRAGTFWIEQHEYNDPLISTLWHFTLDSPTPVKSGQFIDGPFVTVALLVAPAPAAALASTGTDLTVLVVAGGGALAAILMGLGVSRLGRNKGRHPITR